MMRDPSASAPLRILSVVNVPWDPRLGAARVWMELGDEWQRAGHSVERFCLTDAFATPTDSPRVAALRVAMFPARAAAFVRANAARFDVIDALIGTIPSSARALGFRGLLVARSVGLFHSYEKFEREAAVRWGRTDRAGLAARMFYGVLNNRRIALSRRAVHTADLINVPNDDERRVLREELRCETPVIVQPYGLGDDLRAALNPGAAQTAERLRAREVCFLGMWSPRKGARDWQKIIAAVREQVPDARFVFLGTMTDNATVRRDLGSHAEHGVEIVAHYRSDELPGYLRRATVGAFPSYIEGFGIAVIEQLAAGIPVVAYDCPGPRDILRAALPEILVPAGDVHGFANKLIRVLTMSPEDYGAFCASSREVAAAYTWKQIAADTATLYADALRKKSNG